MLSELFIENVAVIEKADIKFSPGLNVLTGETGAGKSILIDSINAILGNRASRDIVRSGTDRAVIWAVFEGLGEKIGEELENMGYDSEENLTLQREISSDGVSRCRINQKPASASAVRELCANLINIHGQHDNQALLNPERHIHIYDGFFDLTDEATALSAVYKRRGELVGKIKSIDVDEAQKERQIDMLRYQIDEIEAADLYAGEDGELSAKRAAVRNSERILESLGAAYAAFNGDEETAGILASFYAASGAVEDIAKYGEEYARLSESMNDQYYALQDISERVGDSLNSFEYDPSRLSGIEERLDLIFKLKRKYGDTVEDIFAFLENAKRELDSINTAERRKEEFEKELSLVSKELKERAAALSEKRVRAAGGFEDRIKAELAYLNMAEADFVVNIETAPIGANGMDKIEFYISTNAGEPPKPLSRVASGGELSRVMLAIKNAVADKDEIGTLIFDEIDAGISGNSAFKIGKKLKQSAAGRQTICVTHSARIASFADNHLFIEKDVRDGKTYTSVRPLDYEARKYELARIISGDNITDISLNNAGEMLALAKEN